MKSKTNSICNRSFTLVVALLAVLFAAGPLHAQVDAGSILGTISDQSGGVLSGAKVTLTNEGTGATLDVYKRQPVEYRTKPQMPMKRCPLGCALPLEQKQRKINLAFPEPAEPTCVLVADAATLATLLWPLPCHSKQRRAWPS